MKIDIVTLFPQACEVPLGLSIMGRARSRGILDLAIHDLRPFGLGKHLSVDDTPYGGGPGMVMRPEPFFEAVDSLRQPGSKVLLMTPQGKTFTQQHAARLSSVPHLIILCAHYEGVDHRVVEFLVDEEISIGDYVLTNGAIAATVVVDAIVRLLPGVLGDDASSVEESFQQPMLEGPHYTKPETYRGHQVPPILLSGHHAEIDAWRHQRGLERTLENRPDLLPPG